MTIQNTLIPLVEVLSLTEKIAEDNKAAWVTLTVTQTPAPLYGAVHLRASDATRTSTTANTVARLIDKYYMCLSIYLYNLLNNLLLVSLYSSLSVVSRRPRSGGGSAKTGGVSRRKRSLVLFCSFRKQLRHRPGKTESKTHRNKHSLWHVVFYTTFP